MESGTSQVYSGTRDMTSQSIVEGDVVTYEMGFAGYLRKVFTPGVTPNLQLMVLDFLSKQLGWYRNI
jgi:hypothetical protein